MYYLLPLFTVFIWGGNTIVNKMVVNEIEPSAMSFFRWFIAIIILSPFCLKSVINSREVIKPYLGKLALLALLGMVLNQSLGYYAGLTTTASNMSMISSLIPLFCIFISQPLLGKQISAVNIIGAIISLVGLAFMLGKGDIFFIFHQAITIGDGLMLIASILYATYCVLLKRWKMPLTTWQLIYIQGLFSVIMLCPFWLSSYHLLPTSASLPFIAYAAIAASIIAPWMWIKAINLLGADTTAMFMNLMPIIVLTMAIFFLGEQIHIFHIEGGLLVITGVMLAQIKWHRKTSIQTINV
ncbi:DMT family transporter [Psychromonas sp. PT13]|uniref:DMT family transporter n=1 Tax=Psychromonas sp. PT13 TaxID=3439547 RepID=UPI003EC054DC